MPRLELSDEALGLLSLRLQRSYEPGTKRGRANRQSQSCLPANSGKSQARKTPVGTGAFLSRSYSSGRTPTKVTRDGYLARVGDPVEFCTVIATALIGHCPENLPRAANGDSEGRGIVGIGGLHGKLAA